MTSVVLYQALMLEISWSLSKDIALKLLRRKALGLIETGVVIFSLNYEKYV